MGNPTFARSTNQTPSIPYLHPRANAITKRIAACTVSAIIYVSVLTTGFAQNPTVATLHRDTVPASETKSDYPRTIFIKSWQGGFLRVQEHSVSTTLTKTKPTFRIHVNDSSGHRRYRLTIEPDYAPGRVIFAWRMVLVDLKEKHHTNLLTRSNDPGQDYFKAEDYVWWLDGSVDPAPLVDLRTRRIINVEDFYCVFDVKDFKRGRQNRNTLNSITVAIRFTNTAP